MLRVTLKGVRGHLLRFLLTATSVMLGVAFVAGTFVLTDNLRRTFDAIFEGANLGIDAVVRGGEGGDALEGGSLRLLLPLELASDLEQVEGVRYVRPMLSGQAVLVGDDGTAVRAGGAPTMAFNFDPEDESIRLVEGRAPSGPGEIVVESQTLTRADLEVGDATTVVAAGDVREVTIVGEGRFAAEGGTFGATVVLFDPVVAQEWFAPEGTTSRFDVFGADGVEPDELTERLSAALPPEAEVITGAEQSAEDRESLQEVLGFISTFLLVFAGIALFVGAFIIFNTFSMLVAQRTRELALLRAVGAGRGQVLRMVLGEAVVVGLLGGILGLLAGVALAVGLRALIGSFGLPLGGDLPVQVRTVVVSLVLGVLVTVISAVMPAVRATRIAPVAAMRDDVALPERGLRVRGAVGLSVLAAGAALLGYGFVLDGSTSAIVVGIAAVAIFLGAAVAAPLVSRPVVRLVAAPMVLVLGSVGRLARQNALRNPRRTATTASALMVGLALVSGVTVLAASAKSSTNDLVDAQLTADFVLNGGGFSQFPAAVAERAAELPGVESVASLGGVPVEVDGEGSFALGADAAALVDSVRMTTVSGDLAALDSGDLAVSESLAEDRGLAVGDQVTTTVGTLVDVDLRVGAIYEDNPVVGAPVLIPMKLYTEGVPAAAQGIFSAYVKVADGADAAQVRDALVELVQPFVIVSVQDRDEFKAAQAAQIDQTLTILYVLLALSVVIAVLGIINTLALSVFERTREIGLLRAVGLTRSQLTGTITVESVTTAVFGALLGTALGLSFAVALQQALADDGLDRLDVPVVQILVMLALSALVGVVAAVLPSIRAVRLNVLRAITTE